MIKPISVKLDHAYLDQTKCLAWLKAELGIKELRNIGHGCYATVYGAKGLDKVYKVGVINQNKDGYLRYVNAILKDAPDNPYTPRIYRMWNLKTGSRQNYYFVIEMERLKSSNGNDALSDTIEKLVCEPSSIHALTRLGVEVPKELVQVTKLISKLLVHSSNDIHPGNIMMRGGQVVITDPIC